MKLRVLGCDGGIGSERKTTSLLIDDDILIDSGSGVGDLSLEELAKIKHVFLTHTHLDHHAFLPLLVDSVFSLITDPIVVHGQLHTIKALKDHIFNWVIWPDFSSLPTPETAVMSYEVMKPSSSVVIDGRTIEMIPVNHIVPTVGYRVESAKGASFAFSGDTCTNDTFWRALNAHNKLDLLIVEAAFSNSEEQLSRVARHYCSKTLAEDIVKLQHRPEVYLSHPKPGDEQDIFAECSQLITQHVIKQLHGGEVFHL